MDKSSSDKIKRDGFLKSMLPGSAYRKEYADTDAKKLSVAAPMGDKSVMQRREKEAGLKAGGTVGKSYKGYGAARKC
jgi:hypothetical protein